MPDTPMTDERLDEIDALEAAATPGPWEAYYGGDRIVRWLPGGEFEYIVDEPVENRDNAAFIAAARTAVPEMAAEIRRLRAENAVTLRLLDEAQKALLFRPVVTGNCPACGRSGLYVGAGGYVTCAHVDCPEPDAASAQFAAKEA